MYNIKIMGNLSHAVKLMSAMNGDALVVTYLRMKIANNVKENGDISVSNVPEMEGENKKALDVTSKRMKAGREIVIIKACKYFVSDYV
jgi:hypothetical protein